MVHLALTGVFRSTGSLRRSVLKFLLAENNALLYRLTVSDQKQTQQTRVNWEEQKIAAVQDNDPVG
jgi:hypothetical protein